MLWIKYQVVQSTVGEEDVLVNKKIGYSEANIAIAEAEAYNGKYEVVEDGKSYNDEPLAIEFGGTGAKTAAEALRKIGAAPAGYGLGETNGRVCTDCNTAVLPGFYALSGSNCVNYPNVFLNAEYGTMRVERRQSYILQVVNFDYRSAERASNDGGATWLNWIDTSPSAFAPAGYGLGTSAKELTSADNLDNIWQNGNYFWNLSAPTNAPVFDGSTQGAYGYMRVDCKDNGTYTQTIRSAHAPNIGITVIRTRIGDAIIEEWENPPMALGKEYRTTERWNDKPVYTMLCNFGAMPNASIKNVVHGIKNIDYPLSASVTAKSSGWAFIIPTAYNVETDVVFSIRELIIKTTANRSEYNAYFTLKYTKTQRG